MLSDSNLVLGRRALCDHRIHASTNHTHHPLTTTLQKLPPDSRCNRHRTQNAAVTQFLFAMTRLLCDQEVPTALQMLRLSHVPQGCCGTVSFKPLQTLLPSPSVHSGFAKSVIRQPIDRILPSD